MGQYYYLGAQLPYLFYEQIPPMTSADFIALASSQMGSSEAALLSYCTLDPEFEAEGGKGEVKGISSSFITRWKNWERVLRLNLAKNRAAKLKREEILEAPDFPSEAVLVAKHAVTIESPLEAELFLDKARWDAIETFQGADVFCEKAMYAYLLKLLLLERRIAFKAEEGFAEYKELYAAILSSQAQV